MDYTAAAALIALFKARDAELFVLARCGIFKLDLEIVSQIRTALNGRSATTLLAKHVAKTEHVEDVLDIRKSRIKTSRSAALMPKPVGSGALLRVREHGVGLGGLLKFIFGGGIARVLIRMMLHSERAVGTLNLNLGRGARNS